ncbi:MAG: Uma2 family endonuclease [Symplocastrum torsivum CPER-KK1]|jgi:Uma2 family endonuclease|uniref:Uma2 family endonuclease n=1 Tax=Symplocastrum torsivum CPER-KK1 TaxID=450513 RepID=A0A951PRR1_9CYAN|nr:Uma2 family endonuclease [Symplocastrum torsivum CPER-KK1]
MTQAIPKQVTFDEFITSYPENSEYRYELHEGVIVEMPKPKGKHSEVAGFLNIELGIVCREAQLPYFIPRECIVRSDDGESGYEPDVIVLDRDAVSSEPRWEGESIITMGRSIRLVVEVVSTNWQDDYLTKLRDYEALGIHEYWIVDYLGLGGRLHIGYPKRPTLSVYQLVEAEYEVQRFREGDRIKSPTFAQLNLTSEQVFRAER